MDLDKNIRDHDLKGIRDEELDKLREDMLNVNLKWRTL